MATDAERQVDLLRLEPGDLLAEQLERRVVVGARHPEQLVVALVAAEDRVGQVEEDDRRLGEVGEPLVLEPAPGHQVAGRRGIDDLVGVDGALGRQRRRRPAGRRATALRMLARRYHDERCQKRLAAWSASDWVASSRSSVAAQAGTSGGGRPVGGDVAAVERLGRRPHRLRAEAERLALVRRQRGRPTPSPEKTVRIVTVWPSSRRLAMRPPHESATSSGCGATKTWVMAGRVYRAATGGSRPSRSSLERSLRRR